MRLCLAESEALRQEIHEGLNVVERWNGTNGFVFFGKGGEVATNRLEDQEISVRPLHLLQTCMVYVNEQIPRQNLRGVSLPVRTGVCPSPQSNMLGLVKTYFGNRPIWLSQAKTPILFHKFPILKHLLFATAYFEGNTDGGMFPSLFNNLNGGYSATEPGAKSGHE